MILSAKVAKIAGYPSVKELKLNPFLTPHTKVDSEWIRDPHVSYKSLRRKQE
jgi:hypothetical protein